jgi:hypothetical protein
MAQDGSRPAEGSEYWTEGREWPERASDSTEATVAM